MLKRNVFQSHYSTIKGVNWLGIGTDNLVTVKSDDRGRMIPEELERCIIQAKETGKLPMIVNATAGTTVLGAFDPLEDIADVCEKHGVWLHVDVSISLIYKKGPLEFFSQANGLRFSFKLCLRYFSLQKFLNCIIIFSGMLGRIFNIFKKA